MLALTKVKADMEFNTRLKSVLEVLKSIAAQQYRTLEQRLFGFPPLDSALEEFLAFVGSLPIKHSLFDEGVPLLMVAVTSDQGLLGGVNTRVVRSAISLMQSQQDQLVILGDQGKNYARDLGISFSAAPGIQDNIRDAQANAFARFLFERVMKEGFRKVQIVYPRALSLVNYKVVASTLLPLPRKNEAGSLINPAHVLLETSPGRILEYAAYISFGLRVKEIFSMSRLAEAAARYTHLEESTQKLDDLNKKLRTRYFRLRHEIVDASMRDLFSARVVYAS